MVKKCIVCNEEAIYKIKDTSDFYCQDCAEENFADLSMLLKLEEEAIKLKEFLKERMSDLSKNEEELDEMVTINEKTSEEKDAQND